MIHREILLNESFCAVTENRRLVEYLPSFQDSQECGDIYIGKVARMMPGINGLFVDIGRKRMGFLPLKENSTTFTGGRLLSGEPVAVQVRREETGSKGVFLSRDLTFAGTYLILMPMNRHIGVSGRIRDEAEIERLKEIGRRLACGRFGLVMRSAATEAEESVLQQEMIQLEEQWQKVSERIADGSGIRKIYSHPDDLSQLLQDYAARGGAETRKVELLPAELTGQLAACRNRRVPLQHGGNIVIDLCEAMTVIDVNSASDTRHPDEQEAFWQINQEACGEIAVQVRLRNLSGMILIDFINMKDPTRKAALLDRLRKAFEPDRVKTVVHDMTALGLVEMTRKHTRPELREYSAAQDTAVTGGTE